MSITVEETHTYNFGNVSLCLIHKCEKTSEGQQLVEEDYQAGRRENNT